MFWCLGSRVSAAGGGAGDVVALAGFQDLVVAVVEAVGEGVEGAVRVVVDALDDAAAGGVAHREEFAGFP